VTAQDERIDYYAIIGVGRTEANPSGLARRRYTSEARMDEALQRNMSWEPTSAITQWEYGNLPGTLRKISEQEAEELIARFRERWGREG
jgi:hypothetical protein